MDFEAQPYHLAFRAHHRHIVTCLLLDSERILTGSDDANVHLYDSQTGVLQRKFEGHESAVWAIQQQGDILVSGSTDRTVRVWSISSGKCLRVFQGHTFTVRHLAILQPVKIGTASDGSSILVPKQPLVISGSRDSTMRVWKLPRPDDRRTCHISPPDDHEADVHSLRILAGHHKAISAMAAYGDTVVSGSSVRVWKVSTGEMVHCLAGHLQKIFSVVLDHVSSRCMSGSMDNSVKIGSIETGDCLFSLDGHTSLVGLLELSQGVLVSGAVDGTLRTWNPDDGVCRSILTGHTEAITCFQHDQQKVVSGSDRALKLWDTRTGQYVRDLLSGLSGIWQVRYDERRCVATVQRDGLSYVEVCVERLTLTRTRAYSL